VCAKRWAPISALKTIRGISNVFDKRVGQTSESDTPTKWYAPYLPIAMPPPNRVQSIQKEGRISIAIHAIQSHQFQSNRSAATTYDIPKSTLHDRIHGKSSRRDCEPNSKKLIKLEETVIIQHILDLDLRGFAPKLSAVIDIANKLLTVWNSGRVRIKWPSNFVKRSPELKTRFNRKYDYQRAKCEDPEVIRKWFELVRNIIQKYDCFF